MELRCAERIGTCTMLWKHEFYMVLEPKYGAYVYQALEFKVGTSLPSEEVQGSSTKEKKEICLGVWRGVCPGAAC
jgi:hypothetical protein